ncbi:MAG: TRAP transporter substrate-binding protein DctP [Alphaproteobacteria bacterium]|nr:TRAP transporter substrate-binding protein DctP [Alphaproteobacteria bacterium]
MKIRNLLLAGAFALASWAGMGASQQAAAQNFVYANPLARNHVQFGVVADEWIAEIQRATENRVRIRHVPGGALLRLENMIEGLTTGVADIGVTNVASSARQLPITSILAGTADITVGNQIDTVGLATVFSRLLQEFPQINKEFADIGLVPMVWIPAFTFAVLTRTPVSTLAELQGKKVRVFGPNLPRIFSAAGATPLAVAAGEIYTSLQTGVIDGAFTTPAAMFSLRWFEQGRHILFLGPRYGAHFMGIGDVYIFNANSWNRVSQADRETIQRVNREFTVAAGRRMQQDGEDSIAQMRQRGITFTNLSPADTAELARRTGDFTAAAAQAINALGHPGTAIANRYRELVAEYAAGRLR